MTENPEYLWSAVTALLDRSRESRSKTMSIILEHGQLAIDVPRFDRTKNVYIGTVTPKDRKQGFTPDNQETILIRLKRARKERTFRP